MNLLDAFFGTNDKDNVIKAQSEQIVRLQAEILELNEAIDKVIKERDELDHTLEKIYSIHEAIVDEVNNMCLYLKGTK
jgi:hypothetical protein